MTFDKDLPRTKLTVIKNKSNISNVLENFAEENNKTRPITTISDIKRVIVENRSKFSLNKNECNIKDLRICEELIIKNLKGAGKGLQKQLYSQLTEIYCLLEFPELAFYNETFLIYTYGSEAVSPSTKELIMLLHEKTIGPENLSDEENMQNFLTRSIERAKTFEEDSKPHWGAAATVAMAYRIVGDQENALKYYSDADSIVSKEYSHLDRSINTTALIPEYRQAEAHYLAVVKNQIPESRSSHTNLKSFKNWSVLEKKFLNIYKNGYVSQDLTNYLGSICNYQDKYSESMDYYAQSIEYNSAYIEPFIFAFYTLMDAGNFKDARLLFKKISYIFPKGDPLEKANSYYEKVVGVRIFDEENISLLPEDLFRENKHREVLEECMEIITTSDVNMNLVDEFYSKEAYNLSVNAMKCLVDGLKSDSTEKLLKAENLANQASILAPQYIDKDLVHLNTYYHLGFFGSCLNMFDKIRLQSGNTYNLGESGVEVRSKILALAENPDPLPFIKHAESTVDKFPEHWAARCNLGYAFRLASYKTTDADTAFKYSKMAYEQYVIAQKKLSLHLTGSEDNFKKIYDSHAGKLSWSMCEPLEGQACTRFDMFDLAQKHNKNYNINLEEAGEQLGILLNMGYGSYDMYYYLGRIYEGDDRFEDAIEAYENAYELESDITIPLIQISSIYLKMGKPSLASAYFKKAKEISPDDFDVLEFERKNKRKLLL